MEYIVKLRLLCWGKVYKNDAALTILIMTLQDILTFKIQSFDADTDFALLDHTALTAENRVTPVTTFSFNITSPGRYGQNWGNATYRAG